MYYKQEGFWRIMKDVFDEHYREAFMQAGLVKDGDLQHLISDAATMQVELLHYPASLHNPSS